MGRETYSAKWAYVVGAAIAIKKGCSNAADDVREGVAIMHLEGVDVSITGNSTNPTRFQHPVAGTYKKECMELGKKYFSVASGGGTGRTLHPDNMAAGPASYGMTDTMGRMPLRGLRLDINRDAQFAGSSSVPAHVEMMGFLGIGNNPMGALFLCLFATSVHQNGPFLGRGYQLAVGGHKKYPFFGRKLIFAPRIHRNHHFCG